jgi:hypothetical protein
MDDADPEITYRHLLDLWTSGVRDYHSLLSDYLTANSIFVAAIGLLLARQPPAVVFTLLVIVLCLFGVLMTLQMAIVLGRFSAQTSLWEWRLRGIERADRWKRPQLFSDLHRYRDRHESLSEQGNDPPAIHPSWAVRQHRRWWARREVSFPLFFGTLYVLILVWSLTQLVGT